MRAWWGCGGICGCCLAGPGRVFSPAIDLSDPGTNLHPALELRLWRSAEAEIAELHSSTVHQPF
jgi:hypothetical protein